MWGVVQIENLGWLDCLRQVRGWVPRCAEANRREQIERAFEIVEKTAWIGVGFEWCKQKVKYLVHQTEELLHRWRAVFPSCGDAAMSRVAVEAYSLTGHIRIRDWHCWRGRMESHRKRLLKEQIRRLFLAGAFERWKAYPVRRYVNCGRVEVV